MAKSRMDEHQLAASVNSMIADSELYEGNGRSRYRELAFKFAEGESDIPHIPGRSSVVSRDVADHIGLTMPSLLRVFFATDRIAIYEPTRKEHEEYAQRATDLVNYIVLRECSGYRHFRNAFEDALKLGNGIIKHWWDDAPVYETTVHTGLDEDQYLYLLEQPDFHEAVDHEEYPDPDFVAPELPPEIMEAIEGASPEQLAMVGVDPAMFQAPMLHDVKIKRITSKGRLRLAAVPNAEFLIDKNATVLDEECRFAAHVQRKTRSQLKKEGYDPKKVDAIPTYAASSDFDDRPERDTLLELEDTAPDASTELVEVFECYILVDFDGDGIAERRRVVMAGESGKRGLLLNEEWEDELPFSDIVPDPRAHVWRGRSLFDDLADVARIKTVSLRAILDNTYQILNPQREVDTSVLSDPNDMDELVNPTFGGLIKKKNSNPAVSPVQIQHIAPQVAPILEYMDQIAEKRTGISQRSQALDMDALQNQSATAVNATLAAAHSKVEEYVRNIAECDGMRRIFACCLKLVVKHQDRAKEIRLRGKVTEVDPRGWDAGMDVTINVGLGTGSRDRDMANLNGVAAKQEQVVLQMGPFNEYVNIGHLFESYRKMAEAAGLKNAESFFPEISQEQIAQIRQQQAEQPPAPDPKMLEAQGKMQMEQQKMQFDMQKDAAKQQADLAASRERMILEFEAERESNSLRMQAMREEGAAKIQLMREESAAKLELMMREAQSKAEARVMEMQIEAQLTREANLTKMATPQPMADTNINGQA